HLADTPTMVAVARHITGEHHGQAPRAEHLLAETAALAARCTQHPRGDLGIGAVHLPEPEVIGLGPADDAMAVLTVRCRDAVPARYPGAAAAHLRTVHDRLDAELATIAALGYPTYFLTVAAVVDLIREMGIRVAARGSGAGSLVNHLLGISGVDPIHHDLLMERFCTPLRAELPDIDIDVESARRTEIYEKVLTRFGGERVTCVSMMDTYKVRHAVRDVGAALGMLPGEIDEIAKAFPHIRARDARSALAELPELRVKGLDSPRLATFFDLVERLDGLPRHIALHPCGVILSNGGLLDRTPVEASWLGFPMSQFDKDDVEVLGLLKLDVLGIRMQSAMAHAIDEVARVDGVRIDLDDRADVPFDDDATFELIQSTRTLGCFQIESPGQRELIGKFGPTAFEDLIIDISLFRPGPVKSDMIRPFLEARHGWADPEHLHDSLIEALRETEGVVVFHEQMLRIIAVTTGCSLAQADEVRRAMGSPAGQEEIEAWWHPAATARGYTPADRTRIWAVLKAFASFGFCKAHAAAFALPTYQSAWLKTHHTAAFLAGVLTHDPGMYPKRLILEDARAFGVDVLGLDINASRDTYRVERVPIPSDPATHRSDDHGDRDDHGDPELGTGAGYGIRIPLSETKGINDAEVARLLSGQPYATLADVWTRAHPSRPTMERLALAGAFDSLYGIGLPGARTNGLGRRGLITRRDVLLHIAELERWDSAGSPRRRKARLALTAADIARNESGRAPDGAPNGGPRAAPDRVLVGGTTAQRAAAQSNAAAPVRPQPAQLTLDLGDAPELTRGSGLPEMTGPERVRAELDVLGLDASGHVVEFYAPMLDALGVTRSTELLRVRTGSEIWVAGVKVATQTPPVRSGRRVVFLTLDDGTGPVDATFFEDVQGPYAATVFHSWMMLVRGVTRRTGEKGISLRATGAWELSGLWEAWLAGGPSAVQTALRDADREARDLDQLTTEALAKADTAGEARGPGARRGRRMLVHASGFKQSPYADTTPAGESPKQGRGAPPSRLVPSDGTPARKLWHSSPGSSGR
uniref:helix-hairpin-helix domain-containing protein n=1 Tax=Kribbia dieselivorans TaxID=331526 RepID=UPI0008399150